MTLSTKLSVFQPLKEYKSVFSYINYQTSITYTSKQVCSEAGEKLELGYGNRSK